MSSAAPRGTIPAVIGLLALALACTGRPAPALLRPSAADAVEAPSSAQSHEFLGLAYMRLGEQENCVAHHGIDSCLVPIKGSGLHALPRGSRGAIEEFSKLLEEKPDDLG